MAKQIALAGQLVDVRNYAQSKSVRLIVEVSAERAGEIIAQFGWPTPVAPVPVAVARLDTEKAAPEPSQAQEKPKRKWGELTPAEQAGIRCGEESFQRFLGELRGEIVVGRPDDAAAIVRKICGVASRRDIVPGLTAAVTWHELDSDYTAWLRYGEAA